MKKSSCDLHSSPHGYSGSAAGRSGSNQSRASGGQFGHGRGGGQSAHGDKVASKHAPRGRGKDRVTPSDDGPSHDSHATTAYDGDGDDWL